MYFDADLAIFGLQDPIAMHTVHAAGHGIIT